LFPQVGNYKDHQITKNYSADDDDYGNNYFGGDFISWVKPDRREGEWTEAKQGDYYKGSFEIPFYFRGLFFKKFAAESALDCIILN
jgi:hypothetical protein